MGDQKITNQFITTNKKFFMKKIFSLFAALLFAGSMMAESYTITFKSTEGADATASLTSTDVADYIASGAEYVSAISASGKVYNGQAGYGLKFGNSSSAGAVTMTLATPVAPTSIVMNASPWSATEGTGLLQDATYDTKSTGAKGTFADFAYEYDGATQVTTIIVGTSTKRGYVKSVTVNCEGGVTPPTPACDWDNIAYAGNGSGNVAHNDRFKVCLGTPAPNFVNLQAPGWADEPGFYFEFPSAAWGAISLDAAEYKIQGAGIILYASAFLYDAEKEVTIVCQDVEYTITVMNNNPETAPVVIPQYEVAEAIAAGLADDTEIEVRGIITRMEMKGKNFAKYGSVNIYVADANGAEGEFEFFNCYSLAADTFRTTVPAYDDSATAFADVTEVTDNNGLTIHVGDTVIAHGTYKLYNTTHELNTGCYLVYAKAPGAPYPTDIDNTAAEQKAIKVIENGQLFIIKNGVRYDAQGAVVR